MPRKRTPAPAAVPVALSGWACSCTRCHHSWVSVCDCRPERGPDGGVVHLLDCEPPTRCPDCGSNYWRVPAGVTRRGRPPKVKPTA